MGQSHAHSPHPHSQQTAPTCLLLLLLCCLHSVFGFWNSLSVKLLPIVFVFVLILFPPSHRRLVPQGEEQLTLNLINYHFMRRLFNSHRQGFPPFPLLSCYLCCFVYSFHKIKHQIFVSPSGNLSHCPSVCLGRNTAVHL